MINVCFNRLVVLHGLFIMQYIWVMCLTSLPLITLANRIPLACLMSGLYDTELTITRSECGNITQVTELQANVFTQVNLSFTELHLGLPNLDTIDPDAFAGLARMTSLWICCWCVF